MAHISGIQVDEELRLYLNSLDRNSATTRVILIKINIPSEKLYLAASFPTKSDLETDFNRYVKGLTDHNPPCYIFIRFDTEKCNGCSWNFISWVPETVSVQEKMLYSSTKAEIIKEFGSNFINQRINYNDSHLNWKNYMEYIGQPENIDYITQKTSHISLNARGNTLQGLYFDLDKEACDTSNSFALGKHDLIAFIIDTEKETIFLKSKMVKASSDDLISLCNEIGTGYILFRYFYRSEEGSESFCTMFVHFNGGYSTSIKSRMLYSSCKLAFLEQLSQRYKIRVDHKIECDDISDLSSEALLLIVNPPKLQKPTAFSKPKPAGRGPPRLH